MNFIDKYNLDVTIVDNSASNIIKLQDCIQQINMEFHRVGCASTLNIKFLLEPNSAIPFNDGSSIMLKNEDKILFKGVIFTTTRDRWGNCNLIAYDYLRYLKNQVFLFEESGVNVDVMIKNIITECGLSSGEIIPIGYSFKIPTIQYNKSAFDLINWFLERAVTNKEINRIFCMYHNYDTDNIDIKYSEDMKQDVVIGEKSLLTDFNIRSTIDEETYTNVAILYDRGGKLGKKECIEVESLEYIPKWGKLRLVQDIPDVGYNQIYQNEGGGSDSGSDAYIKSLAEEMLKYYCRPTFDLSFTSFGILGIRAGQMLKIDVPNTVIGLNNEQNWDNFALLEKVSHKFTESCHTMSIECKVGVIG